MCISENLRYNKKMNLETLFLQIFNEAKDRFIKELALTDEEKDKYITLFKTHPELEKEIDIRAEV